MPTSSNPKPDSGKKSLPVKWQDRAWLPRIVIRSASRRIETRELGQWAELLAAWNVDAEKSRCRAERRSAKTSRGFPMNCLSGRRQPGTVFLPSDARLRYSPPSQSNNPFEL